MENSLANGQGPQTLKIEKGRPQDMSGRLAKEQRVYALLGGLGISYERVDHEPLMTIEACAGVDALLGVHICKNLFLCNAQRTQFYLLLMPGEKKFRTAVLSRQIGSARLSFADEGHMLAFLDITPGSVSVMGLMNDREHRVRLLIDRDVLQTPRFACHPCINTSSLCMDTRDLIEKVLPAMGVTYTVVDL